MGIVFAFSRRPETALYGGGSFLLLVVIYNLFFTRLSEVQVDKEKGKLTFIYRNYFKTGKVLAFDIANVAFTYKRGATFKSDETRNICTLYNAGKEIVVLRHDRGGWTNDEIFDLLHELKGLGVKRKFTGYMMKDAEV